MGLQLELLTSLVNLKMGIFDDPLNNSFKGR